MSTKTLVIGIIGTGCIAAAGAGGYLAQRLGPAEPVVESVQAAVPTSHELTAGPGVQAEAPQPGEQLTRPAASVPAAPARPPRQAANRPSNADPRDVPAVARPESGEEVPPPPPPAPETWPEPVDVGPPTELPSVRPGTIDPMTVPPPVEPARFIELTVAEDAVIGIRLESSLSTETAKIEDRVVARVTRDVTVDGRTAIPAGARLEGNVTLVESGGRFRERARLGVRFTRLVLSDDSVVRLETETIFRDGESPTGEAASKVGASAAIGAILGGVIGGKKGAVIGGTAGAAGGTAVVVAGGPNAAVLPEGTSLTVRLTQPVTLLIERHDQAR